MLRKSQPNISSIIIGKSRLRQKFLFKKMCIKHLRVYFQSYGHLSLICISCLQFRKHVVKVKTKDQTRIQEFHKHLR